MSLTFSFKYFHKSLALTIATVMSQQSERMNLTKVDLQLNAWDFLEELPGNLTEPLGSEYLELILELSDCDSASALSREDVLTSLQIYAGGF